MQEEQYLLSEDRRQHGGMDNMDTGRRTEPEAEESAYHSDEFKTKLELVVQRMVETNILAGLSLYKGELALARETCHSEEGAGHTRVSSDISEDWTTGNKEQSIIHAGSREDESLCRKREIFAETLAQKTLWDALNVFGTGDAKLKERRNDPRDLRNGVPFPDNDTAAAPEETNDPTKISIPQDGISFDEEKLGTICDELFDLCLESRFDAMETSRKVEFALADISRKKSLEATQVASLHGTVETMKEAHAKLIEVYDCVTEGIAHQKTDKEEITVSFPDTLVLKAKRSQLEISGESCRLLGSAIAELVKNIASAVEKNNEVHTEKQTAMKQKLRRRKRSFSETLGEKHAEIEGLIKENAQMKDIIEEGRMEKLSIEAFIDSLSRENEKLVDEVEALSREQTAEREAHRQEVDSMAAEDQYKEREICNLKRDLKRKESQIKLIESEYDKALAREDASLLLVEDSEATSRKRQEQLKQLESYFTDLRDDVQNLTQEVAAGRTAEENTPDCSGFRVTHGGAERSMGTLTAAQSRTEGGEIDRHASSALGSSRRMAREARQSRSKSMLLGVQPLGEGIRNATLEMKRLKKRAASLGLQNREMRMEVEKLRMRLEETSSPQQDRSYQAKWSTQKLCSEDTKHFSCAGCRTSLQIPKEVSSLLCGASENNWTLATGTLDASEDWGSNSTSEELGKQLYDTTSGGATLHVHHISLLQRDLDKAREDLLDKNKEACELKHSSALFEIKMRERDLAEQEMRAKLTLLSTRCHELEQAVYCLRTGSTTFPSVQNILNQSLSKIGNY